MSNIQEFLLWASMPTHSRRAEREWVSMIIGEARTEVALLGRGSKLVTQPLSN
jgi:hypothetical protein